jgi:hypothetical protein
VKTSRAREQEGTGTGDGERETVQYADSAVDVTPRAETSQDFPMHLLLSLVVCTVVHVTLSGADRRVAITRDDVPAAETVAD